MYRVTAGFGIIIALIFGTAVFTDYTTCHSKWDRSGFSVSWGPMQGCIIDDGKGPIPADNYRRF